MNVRILIIISSLNQKSPIKPQILEVTRNRISAGVVIFKQLPLQ